jgi:hypothetical protein
VRAGVLSLSLSLPLARSRVQDHTLGVVQLASHFQETKLREDECSSRGWIGERADFPTGHCLCRYEETEKTLFFQKKKKGEKTKEEGERAGGELELICRYQI